MIPKSFTLLMLAITASHAETRLWRSADGSKSFRGEFIIQSANEVTIRNESGKELTFPLAKLHPDDLLWISGQARKAEAEAGLFGGIRFGETEAQVLARLKTNPHIILPRSGELSTRLADVKTKSKLGGSAASVGFLWTVKENVNYLCSIDITCTPQKLAEYDKSLKTCHDELALLLTSIHGKPATTAPYPARDSLQLNEITPGNSWTFSDGSSLEQGIGLIVNGLYLAVARYSPPPL